MAKSPVAPAETTLSSADVVQELDRIAASTSFRKATQCVRLLRHITKVTLDGRSSELKEYALGVTVFDRPESYDSRIDPIVRLEARRLRLKLAEYYRLEGSADAVVIDLPKGAYIPDFRLRISDAQPLAVLPEKHRWRPALIAAILAVLILTAAGYNYYGRRGAVPSRPLIGVVGFRDLSSGTSTSWVASAVSELLNIDLDSSQQMRAVPLENVARMKTELSLTPQAAYAAGTLQQIRANLGIDYVVTGTYLDRNRRIHLDLMLFDARSGRQVAAIGEDAMEDHLSELTQRCAGRIRTQLGVRLAAMESAPPRLEAAAMEPYARGMERLRQSDALNARGYLEQAAAVDPSNPLIHSGLAAAWSMLGLDGRAQREAKLAFDSSTGLPRVEQLEIEGRYRAIAHEWPRAIQVYQALVTLLPEDLEYGLLLASVETSGGKAQDALTSIASLRNLPASLGDDPRIDLAEAQAAGALSDFAHTQRAAQRAAEKANLRGARLQYARARLLQSGAMQNLAVAGFQDVRAEARRICAELGDRSCVAAAYRIEGNNMLGDGHLDEARRLYRAALEIANDIGNSLEKLNALTGLAYASQLQGDLKAAEARDRDALTVGKEMGPLKSYPVSLDLAQVLVAEGRMPEARRLIEEAREIPSQFGDREGVGLSDAALAHLLACEGNLTEAIVHYRDALETLRQVNDPELVRETLLVLGDAQLDAGDSAAARKSYEEARGLTQKFRAGPIAAEIEMAFARLSFQEAQWKDAVPHAKAALSGFTASGRKGDRYEAAALLSRALLKLGRIEDAARVMTQFPLLDGTAFPVWTVVRFQIARCLVLANTGKRTEALRDMDNVSAHAERSGFPLLKKEALLAKEEVVKIREQRAARN